MNDREFYQYALNEAKLGRSEGGIPIGAALVVDGKVLAVGHNRRVQMGSSIRHGETDCIENAGRQPASIYARATLYTTLSPCFMCAGTAALYKIPRIVLGESRTYQESESWLKSRGVEIIQLDDAETYQLMQDFVRDCPELWNEDIGE